MLTKIKAKNEINLLIPKLEIRMEDQQKIAGKIKSIFEEAKRGTTK